MADVIWKFPLELTGRQRIPVPWTARVLTVQLQNGKPCVWLQLNTRHAVVDGIEIYHVGTGHEVPETARSYVGTYQIDGFVWHVFTDQLHD